MPNQRVAELIAQRMPTGLPHPGNRETNQPPILIPLPAFRTTGMPAEMADQISNTTTLIGEAIVNLIETEGDSEIIGRAELDGLRAAEQRPGAPLAVLCSGCRKPLLWLNVVNGQAVVNTHVLGGVNLDCPHTISEDGA
jgi:hypothetical protein